MDFEDPDPEYWLKEKLAEKLHHRAYLTLKDRKIWLLKVLNKNIWHEKFVRPQIQPFSGNSGTRAILLRTKKDISTEFPIFKK